jgi:hypothetical protein
VFQGHWPQSAGLQFVEIDRMLWFFQRGNEHLRIETTHDRTSGAFSLTVHMTDGSSLTETFPDQAAFEQRLEVLEEQLTADRWTAKGSALLPKLPPQQPN